MNILFYGNCQLFAISQTLNLHISHTITNVECWKNDIDEDYFCQIIKSSNVIVTQPINDNYRDKHYLSTSFIVRNKSSHCKLIIFDSCHFDFYFIDLKYHLHNGDVLHNPIDYHYESMIQHYKNGQTVEEYIENVVNNINFKTMEEMETLAENSLIQLSQRYDQNNLKYGIVYNTHIISTHDFIKNNYKQKLLFYSMNHPSNILIQFICEKIVDVLKLPNTINYEIDILNNPKCILYKCISKVVEFDVNKCIPLTYDCVDIKTIVQTYYNVYNTLKILF